MENSREKNERYQISVVVPVYNVEQYLKRCVDSILAQTMKDLEIILVDDGSTDGSGALCDAYAAQFEQIQVHHKENGGLRLPGRRALPLPLGNTPVLWTAMTGSIRICMRKCLLWRSGSRQI